jgi:hypothetical protein
MKIKVTWKAFGNKIEQGRFVSSVEFDILDYKIPADKYPALLHAIYKATNLQSDLEEFNGSAFEIYLWKVIEARLAPDRTHTSISIGDEVEIDGQTYICADIGWLKAEDAEIQYVSDDYGTGIVFSVRKKVKV